MAPNSAVPEEQVVVGEEIEHVRVVTLNRPRQLNAISPELVSLLATYLEKWERDENAELVIIKGAGRAFCAGGDLRVFYDGRKTKDACLEVVYRFYWLCYHISTYKKTQVALVHGISMGGGAALMVPLKFSVVTEKTVFATPEASFGFHTDCGFSYYHSRLPGHLGEYLALTGGRLSGKEIVAAGLATHFVPSEKIGELEKRLISLNSGDENAIRSVIEEFSSEVNLDEESILNKQSTINDCFSKDSVEEIIKSLVREGRNETLAHCLKREFRLTINILRTTISEDMYEGIRALTVDKDNSPKWEPSSLDKVEDAKLDLIFQPFDKNLELHIPESEESRWDGKYENSAYAVPN
ncbi:3-hydroxyisobutyryl-CoA hydrolase-like protein 5 isoform X2 [Phaseolus vulgaris]|uniref:3-hydroxyisobutyryl-CoA hydrolase-like protein 5 isoform X2 n=1 Tax=Phaseolus vulgaris TaxID=3885 RepID=UPI0035CC05D7